MMPNRLFVGGVADGQKIRLLRKQKAVFVHIPPNIGYQEYVCDGGTFFAAGIHRQIPWNAPIARPR